MALFGNPDHEYVAVRPSRQDGCFLLEYRVSEDNVMLNGIVDSMMARFPEDPDILQRHHGHIVGEPIFATLDIPNQGCSDMQIANIFRGICIQFEQNINL